MVPERRASDAVRRSRRLVFVFRVEALRCEAYLCGWGRDAVVLCSLKFTETFNCGWDETAVMLSSIQKNVRRGKGKVEGWVGRQRSRDRSFRLGSRGARGVSCLAYAQCIV